MDMFQKCIETVQNCLVDAKMNKDDIDELVLVGGSSRILKVQELLRNLFDGKKLCASINPDEAVAYGAAVQAAILSREDNVKAPSIKLVEVTQLSLGLEIAGEIMSAVIPKHTIIPAIGVCGFVTYYDNQTAAEFKVFEGERAKTTENRLLGNFRLTDIPPAPRGVTKFDVCFDLQVDGILNVSARDESTGEENSITIESERLSWEEIEKMIKEADKYKADDEKIKEKFKARRAFETYVCKMRDEIQVDSKYKFSAGKKKKAEDAIEEAFEWLDSSLDLAEVAVYEENKKELMAMLKELRMT